MSSSRTWPTNDSWSDEDCSEAAPACIAGKPNAIERGTQKGTRLACEPHVCCCLLLRDGVSLSENLPLRQQTDLAASLLFLQFD